MEGLLAKMSTFMPNKPVMNVNGRKMKVIQLSLQRLSFNRKDCRASLIATLL